MTHNSHLNTRPEEMTIVTPHGNKVPSIFYIVFSATLQKTGGGNRGRSWQIYMNLKIYFNAKQLLSKLKDKVYLSYPH